MKRCCAVVMVMCLAVFSQQGMASSKTVTCDVSGMSVVDYGYGPVSTCYSADGEGGDEFTLPTTSVMALKVNCNNDGSPTYSPLSMGIYCDSTDLYVSTLYSNGENATFLVENRSTTNSETFYLQNIACNNPLQGTAPTTIMAHSSSGSGSCAVDSDFSNLNPQ